MIPTLLNLKLEICKRQLSAAKISKFLGIDQKTMSLKVNEKTEFTRKEMYAIHKEFFPDVDFYYLFLSDGER